MMSNSCEFVRVWFGITALGAIAVLINTALTGAFLRHQIETAESALIVVDVDFQGALEEIMPALTLSCRLVVVGEPSAESPSDAQPLRWQDYMAAEIYQGPMPSTGDIACIMYTSGTDGPSKAVAMPHAHCTLFGIGMLEAAQLGDKDRFYIVLPLFHANALLISLGATLLAGITAIIRPRFSASAWLDDIRTYGATVTSCLGAVAAFVAAQPASANDRSHSLRFVLNAPNPPEMDAAFRNRFGVHDVVSAYGMTEVNLCVWGRAGLSTPGAAGWPDTKRFDVIVADPANDSELPRGSFGEILVRPKIPGAFMAGYYKMAETTVAAWRNLWFHTGDGGVMADDGLLIFVDRIRDCIRRRGENISVSEIELALLKIPGIAEVAAYAVPSDLPGGEDDVMLAVVLLRGSPLTLANLTEAIQQRLPRFMGPRYIRFVDALPKTSTGKVQRARLRELGTAGAHEVTT
jgi:crotonobetaine/carnitine-CoA ligase